MSVTTIDTTLPGDLFQHADPAGLLRDDSAKGFQIELRRRLKAEFPQANVFLRWSPNRVGDTDVLTLPPEQSACAERVEQIVSGLLAEPDVWVKRA